MENENKIIESPKEYDKYNFKSISSPDKERRAEGFIAKKVDNFLNSDVFILMKDLDQDPNELKNLNTLRLNDAVERDNEIK